MAYMLDWSIRLRKKCRVPPKPKKVVGVYEREPGNWCGRYRGPDGKLVRKSFGLDRRAAVDWVDEARVLRRAGTLPSSAKRKKVQKDEVVTVATSAARFWPTSRVTRKSTGIKRTHPAASRRSARRSREGRLPRSQRRRSKTGWRVCRRIAN